MKYAFILSKTFLNQAVIFSDKLMPLEELEEDEEESGLLPNFPLVILQSVGQPFSSCLSRVYL